MDAANADSYDVWWGYDTANVTTKTKWVTTYSCNFLNDSGSYWSSIMQGVHLVMGYGSVMWIDSAEGQHFGSNVASCMMSIKDSFFDSSRAYQPGNSTPTICRVLGAAISENDTIAEYSRKPAPIGGDDEYYYWTITVQPN